MKKLFTLLFAFAILFSANAQPLLEEGFEGTFLPTGWTKYIPDAANDITQSSTQAHTGTYSARFSSYSTSSDYNQYLFSPQVTIPASAELSFWHQKSSSTNELLEWGISTTTNPGDFTWTAVTLEEDVWNQEVGLDLSAWSGQDVYIGFHYYGNYLYYVYLDDVLVEDLTLAHDIGVDVVKPTFVNSGYSYTPKVTLHNYGTDMESDFDVIVTIDDGTKAEVYRDTVFTTGASFWGGDDRLVTMDDEWITPGDGTYSITAVVVLAADENLANNVLVDNCIVGEGSIAYCWPQGAQSQVTQGPSYFFLEDPGTIYNLTEETTKWAYAGAWAQHVWYAAYYQDQDLVSISTDDGAITVIGGLGVALNGMAYDNSTNTMYGITNTSLYTIDLVTGAASLIGDLGVGGSTFRNLACSEAGDLYSVNMDDASLYSVDESTPSASIVGTGLGITVVLAQDMEYDVENDILYMAAYEVAGVSNLRTINVTTGVASDPIGAFPGSQICGFAIPYSLPTDVLAYSFPEQSAPADIDYIAHTIDIDVVYGTSLTALIADFTLVGTATAVVGATPQVSGTTPNDFSSPVTYTVTGDDASVQDWVVTVGIAQNTAADILTYSLPGQTGVTIDDVNETVHVDFPFGTDVSNLIATFTLSDGADADVGGTPQVSGTTANDFTSTVNYTVTAENGTDVAYWTVYADIADNDSTDILDFSFTETIETGVLDIDDVAHTVNIEVYYGTVVTALHAEFVLSTGALAFIGGVPQVSGNTINDFTTPLTYTIEAEDGTTQDWIVTVDFAEGIDELAANGISIYPNPSNGVFNVNVTETLNLEVIDITGKVVKTQVLDNNTNTVNIEEQGTYILRFTNDKISVTQRIIIN